jgi:carbonic anhydrase
LIPAVPNDGEAFGYDGIVGPLYWGDMYDSCNGFNQSPININSSDVTEVTLKPLKFKRFNEEFNDAVIINNGHTGKRLGSMQTDA